MYCKEAVYEVITDVFRMQLDKFLNDFKIVVGKGWSP